MRVIVAVVMISCASGATRPPAPAAIANVASDEGPRLDDLAFLTGCWTYYHIDYGFDVCWERRSETWHGRWETKGPMAHARTITLDIARRGGRIELTADPSVDWFDGVEHIELAHLAKHTALFGHGEKRIAWALGASRDQLFLVTGGTYVLSRYAN